MQKFGAVDGGKEGEISFSEFRDSLVLINCCDFSKIADEWMHYSGEHGSSSGGGTTVDNNQHSWGPALSGGISAGISRTIVAPLERLRMQMICDGSRFNGSTITCARSVLREEGALGFWRGNGVNMLRIFPQNAVAFTCKVSIKKAVENQFGKGLPQTIASSSLSGCVCISSVYPLDLIRGRITTSPGAYNGVVDAFKKIVSVEGTNALFKGLAHANAWAVPYYAGTFVSYDYAKEFYVSYGVREDGERVVGPIVGLGLGMFAGVFGTCCGFPLESARRKLQMQGTNGRPFVYSGILDCLMGTLKNEGIGGVFRGVGANCAKMAPASAITFACYERILETVNSV